MATTIQKVSITHDNIIDFVIAQPSSTHREIAAAFGYSPEGIGIIVRSDAFKARLAARKDVLVDPIIKQNVEERLTGMAQASIDILQRKLATSDDPKLALACLDASTKANQYGARGAQVGSLQFVVNLPGPASSTNEWASKFAGPKSLVEADMQNIVDVVEETNQQSLF